MGRQFDIPLFYRSPIINAIKSNRKSGDPRKKDISPSGIDLGRLRFKVARHFGFCYGVENAIEITYNALRENPGRSVFLLSEMIHNPRVNNDLIERGVRFIQETDGTQRIPFTELRPGDIVIVPAFGTTLELFRTLSEIGIDPMVYNATCPFVEKVWNRAAELGRKGYTIIIHGKHYHEETRATFSHARVSAPALVIRDMREAEMLAETMRGVFHAADFFSTFAEKYSEGFDPARDLDRIGVVNQTTMLATETQDISDFLRGVMREIHGEANLTHYFADTKDTLCYATAENQNAVTALIESGGDLAIVVGGYNSSNTSHLVRLCERTVPTYYIKDAEEIADLQRIRHLNVDTRRTQETTGWFPIDRPNVEILITAGASSPDALVDQVITRVAELAGVRGELDGAMARFGVEAGADL